MSATREQRYATSVYELIRRTQARDETYRQTYGSMAHKLPILIRTAGLVQALEFVATRSDRPAGINAPRDLLNDVALVLGRPDGAALREASRTAPLGVYMRLTQEALEALLWFKRYAQSVLGVEGDQGDDA